MTHDTTNDADATQTMKDVSHTHPYTGKTTGHLFRRGPVVAADGGEADAVEEEPETMRDVSHTPPNDADDANGVFERGRETRGASERSSARRAREGTEETRVEDEE